MVHLRVAWRALIDSLTRNSLELGLLTAEPLHMRSPARRRKRTFRPKRFRQCSQRIETVHERPQCGRLHLTTARRWTTVGSAQLFCLASSAVLSLSAWSRLMHGTRTGKHRFHKQLTFSRARRSSPALKSEQLRSLAWVKSDCPRSRHHPILCDSVGRPARPLRQRRRVPFRAPHRNVICKLDVSATCEAPGSEPVPSGPVCIAASGARLMKMTQMI